MAEWPLQTLGNGAGALEFALILVPLLLALVLALCVRRPTDAAQFDGRASELSALGVGLSLAASDLSLAAALLVLPLAAALPSGGLVCMQGIVIGGVFGRWIASRWMLPAAFAAGERRALAHVEQRLGRGAGALLAWVFSLGALLATVGRVFLFVYALQLSIGASLPLGGWLGFGLIALVVWLVAALLALLRGLRGSIAGDGLFLLVLLAAAVAGLLGCVVRLEGGYERFLQALVGSHKDHLLAFGTSPGLEHTFWTALLVSSLASAAHYGADPLQQTRLLATGSLARARKALWWSLVGSVPAIGLCLIGACMMAWSEQVRGRIDGPSPLASTLELARWPSFVAEKLSFWPRVIVLAGCAVSAVVAAKTVLGALVQLAAARRRRRTGSEPGLAWMRWMTAASAAGILGLGIALGPAIASRPALLESLQLAGECATGLLVAALGLALLRRPPAVEGLFWAAPLSLVAVFLLALRGPGAERATWVFGAGYFLAWAGWRFLPDWFGYRRRAGALVELAAIAVALFLLVWGVRWGLVPVERHLRYDPEWVWLPLSPAWYVPTGGWIGFVFGCLLARGSAGSSEGIAQNPAR